MDNINGQQEERKFLADAGVWCLIELFTSNTIKEFLQENKDKVVATICNYLPKLRTIEVRLKAGKNYATRYIIPEVILNCRDIDLQKELYRNRVAIEGEIERCVADIINGKI